MQSQEQPPPRAPKLGCCAWRARVNGTSRAPRPSVSGCPSLLVYVYRMLRNSQREFAPGASSEPHTVPRGRQGRQESPLSGKGGPGSLSLCAQAARARGVELCLPGSAGSSRDRAPGASPPTRAALSGSSRNPMVLSSPPARPRIPPLPGATRSHVRTLCWPRGSIRCSLFSSLVLRETSSAVRLQGKPVPKDHDQTPVWAAFSGRQKDPGPTHSPLPLTRSLFQVI